MMMIAPRRGVIRISQRARVEVICSMYLANCMCNRPHRHTRQRERQDRLEHDVVDLSGDDVDIGVQFKVAEHGIELFVAGYSSNLRFIDVERPVAEKATKDRVANKGCAVAVREACFED